MSVDQTIQTFSGIANENEFYGHHYLAEVFQGDIKALIDQWNAAEEAARSSDPSSFNLQPSSFSSRAPHRRLGGLGGKWFSGVSAFAKLKDPAERLRAHAALHQPLLEALGYRIQPRELELQAGQPIPVWSVLGKDGDPPRLLVVPAYDPEADEEADTLELRPVLSLHTSSFILPPGPTSSLTPSSVPTTHRVSSSSSASPSGSCSTATSGRTTASSASTGRKSSTARKTTPSRPPPPCSTATASPRKPARACWKASTPTPTSTPSASARI